jgi:uncharacterized protein
MKLKLKYILLLATAFCFLKANAQYNKALADSLGADEYGMKMYYFVILKTGKAEVKDDATMKILFRGHMDNIIKLSKEGKLIVAGPLEDNPNKYRGIFIFSAHSKEEVEQYLKADPAINAGVFESEIYNWYGSAALPAYLPFHQQIEMKKH